MYDAYVYHKMTSLSKIHAYALSDTGGATTSEIHMDTKFIFFGN